MAPARPGDVLGAPPLPDGTRQRRIAVTREVQERPLLAVLLAHEEEREPGAQHDEGRQRCERRARHEHGQALTGRSVADLVVILDGRDEAGRLEPRRARPPDLSPELGALALKGEALAQRPDELRQPAEIGVEAVPLTGEERVHGVVEVIRPHGRATPAERRRVHHHAIFEVALRHHVDGASLLDREGSRCVTDVRHQMARAVVGNGVDGVEPQRVHAKVAQPLEGSLQDEGAHLRGALAVVVHAVTPGRPVTFCEVRTECGEVVPLRPEVVVDDVQAHRETEAVCGVGEAHQGGGAAVALVHRMERHAVVSPVPAARERLHRQQFDTGHAQLHEVTEPRRRRVERTLGREGPHVEFVEHEFLEREPHGRVQPGVAARFEDLRAGVDAVRLPTRRRIRERPPVRQDKGVAVALLRTGDEGAPPTIAAGLERKVPGPHPEREPPQPGRPHGEADAVPRHLGTVDGPCHAGM
ncbi:MAG: hypothetical protein A2V77_00580 [Anaeromyxobacter sp. RBG_16_69_14]|nr:MAG: hypothetical protein A2V77_00580 [Anaeromyxobacter sp. RBG_16_69_14]